VCGFEDLLPTFLRIDWPPRMRFRPGLDCVTFAPDTSGAEANAAGHFCIANRRAIGWASSACAWATGKRLRRNLESAAEGEGSKPGEIELYNLAQDPPEQKDVAGEHPEVVKELSALMEKQHVEVGNCFRCVRWMGAIAAAVDGRNPVILHFPAIPIEADCPLMKNSVKTLSEFESCPTHLGHPDVVGRSCR